MRRLIQRVILCLILFGALFCSARAVSPFTTSEESIAFIKKQEGFSKYKVWDYSQYSIGYGTACMASEYPNGITYEEADRLMRAKLTKLEYQLDGFIKKYNLPFTQNNYDALMSFTYNLGTSWMYTHNRLSDLLSSGEPFGPSDFASALSVWCHTAKGISGGLIERRILETQIFLYGDYTGKNSQQYCYVIFHPNGGEITSDIYFFQKDGFYGQLQTATKPEDSEQSNFVGWFRSDGTQLTAASIVKENCEVTARWSDYEGAASVFSDVKSSDWYCSYIDELYNSGIIGGFPDGTFRPNASLTLAQALKLILSACGMAPQDSVDQSHWANGWRLRAEMEGILTHDEMLNLDAPVSREMVATIAAKALRLSTQQLPQGVFKDSNGEYVLALYSAKIMEGTLDANGTRSFHPSDSIRRSEICAVISRIKNYTA